MGFRPAAPGAVQGGGAGSGSDLRLAARCVVDGVPVPQGSTRFVPAKFGGRAVPKVEPRMLEWRSRIAEAARSQAPSCFVADAPVIVFARFRLVRPKSAKKTMSGHELAAKRPDIDKLARAVLDALTGVWFTDDALVVELRVSKRVCDLGERPGLNVELWRFAPASS